MKDNLYEVCVLFVSVKLSWFESNDIDLVLSKDFNFMGFKLKVFVLVLSSILYRECVMWCLSGIVLDKIVSLMDVVEDCGIFLVEVFN